MSTATSPADPSFANVIDRLDLIQSRCLDLTAFWPTLGPWWSERQAGVFRSSGFGRWAPLASSTLIRRVRDGIASSDPLVRTGILRSEVSSPTPVKTAPSYVIFGSAGGTNISGGLFARAGKHGPRRNPVPGLYVQERRKVRDKMAEWLMQERRNAGA